MTKKLDLFTNLCSFVCHGAVSLNSVSLNLPRNTLFSHATDIFFFHAFSYFCFPIILLTASVVFIVLNVDHIWFLLKKTTLLKPTVYQQTWACTRVVGWVSFVIKNYCLHHWIVKFQSFDWLPW